MDRIEAMNKAIEIINEQDQKIVLMPKFTPVPYGKYLMERYKFIYDKYGRFWRYDNKDGVWKEDAQEFINYETRSSLFGDEQQKKNYVSEVVNYIRDVVYNPNFENILAENLIPFKNCIYNIDNGEFIEFNENYFVTAKIPIVIDSNYNECSIIDSFFDDIVDKDTKETLYELIAYCMYRSQPYQKLFFLFGGGKNGKSTYLELVRSFLGNDNVSSVSPHDICSQRFAIGQMWNKYANISSDISYEILQQVNKIKEITGGDTVSVERKFKDAFPTKIHAKQIYSTNQLPIINDNTEAWSRRIYLIQFPNKIDNPDRSILNKLIKPIELSGLAWKCAKILKRMKDNGFVFTWDIDEQKIFQIYQDLSNPLDKFLRENTEDDINGSIWKFEFRDKFESWCKLNNLRVWNDTNIGTIMKEKYEDEKKTYPLSKDKRYWAWAGLKWKRVSSVQPVHSVNTTTISSIYIKSSIVPYGQLRQSGQKNDI